MIRWKLHVEQYGKIASAKLDIGPFMAFVGDNNSGKSYLLSLIWGIFVIGRKNLYHNADVLTTPEWKECREWLISAYEKEENLELDIRSHISLINQVLNQLLELNKDNFIKTLFNFEDISIGKLEMTLNAEAFSKVSMVTTGEGEKRWMEIVNSKSAWFRTRSPKGSRPDANHLFRTLVNAGILGEFFTPFNTSHYEEEVGYLPSARTGFMLTKDIINRVSRNETFNYIASGKSTGSVLSEENEEADMPAIQPFIRPINHFLNLMAEMSEDEKAPYGKLVQFIEKHMAKGKVDISSLPGREIRYFPEGMNRDMPLRMTSAVVTELSPLLLLLEHKPELKGLFYEEPEMCLHPQLQQQMGRLLIRMANAGLLVIITTHSDTILQHFNNMIKLSSLANRKELQKKFGYSDKDLLSGKDIKIYQLRDHGSFTKITALKPGKYGFEIPTFNDALDKLLEEVYAFQPEDEEEDG